MNILVTGAAGNLGSAVYLHLKQKGFAVTGTDRFAPTQPDDSLEVADLLDESAAMRLCAGRTTLVHLANWPNYHATDPLRLFKENVAMNMNLFMAATASGVRQIIFASSIQVFTDDRRRLSDAEKPSSLAYLPLDGDLPTQPHNTYALSKCVGEQQLAYMVDQGVLNSGVAVRFPSLLKPIVFTEPAIRARVTNLNPAATADYAFTWLSHGDAARLIEAILMASLPGYRCYFPSATEPCVPLQPMELAARYFSTVPLRRENPLDSLVDISRITAETGWSPQDSIHCSPVASSL